jgi:hypothetical protein
MYQLMKRKPPKENIVFVMIALLAAVCGGLLLA